MFFFLFCNTVDLQCVNFYCTAVTIYIYIYTQTEDEMAGWHH